MKAEIIAEIAQAHDGSIGFAHSFIDLAVECGADTVKFQAHFAAEESHIDEPWRVKFSYKSESRYDYWKRMEFSEAEWSGLKDHCDTVGIEFLCSPFSIKAVDLLERLNIKKYKIASGEITNLPMLDLIRKTGKPVIFSSGMSDYDELNKTFDLFERNEKTILQCTSKYPVEYNEIGLNVMRDLRNRYPNSRVGLSDHSGDIYASLAALALGAECIEVHLTHHKAAFGPDVSSSLEPSQLKTLTEGATKIHQMMSSKIDKSIIAPETQEMRKIFMKSIYLRDDMEAGRRINFEDLKFLKPNRGIPAMDYQNVLGKKLKYKKIKNHSLNWEDLDD